MAAVARRLDLFHATNYWVPRLPRTPVVATLCDAVPLSHPEWVPARWRSVKNSLLRRSARWADRVITLSAAAVDDIVRAYGVASAKIRVVPPGLSETWFVGPDPSQVKDTLLKFDLHPGFFLFVGTLQGRKNAARVIAAHQALPLDLRRARPLIVAGRYGWGCEALVEDLQELQRRGEGCWLGYVPDCELRALYRAAVALVFPSLYEGLGLTVLEAFASETCVVTSNRGALREVAGDAALLVDPEQESAIRDAMLNVAEDERLRRSLIARGRLRVQGMSWRRHAEATVKVYRELL